MWEERESGLSTEHTVTTNGSFYDTIRGGREGGREREREREREGEGGREREADREKTAAVLDQIAKMNGVREEEGEVRDDPAF